MKNILDFTGATVTTATGAVISWNTVLDTLKTSVEVYGHTKGSRLSQEDLEDLFQYSSLKIHMCINTFDPAKSRIQTWVNRVMNSCASDMYKRMVRYNRTFVTEDISDFENISATCGSRQYEADETERLIWNIINSMNWNDQAILRLTALGSKPAEIARKLDLPLKTVYMKSFRAKQKLAKELSLYGISV